MAYVTEAQLKTRFGASEITAAPEDAGAIAKALSDASDLIDLYLSARYELPLTATPPILERLNCVLARYYLYDDKPSDHVQSEYDKAIKMLEDIAKGIFSLSSVDAIALGSGDPGYNEGKKYFTDADLVGY